jgi:hypothetical protein
MKLNKLQRHTAYIIMLVELESQRYSDDDWYRFQLCHLVYKLFGIDNKGFSDVWEGRWFGGCDHPISINLVLDYFPELAIKKNYENWPRWSREAVEFRKNILKQCIEETY